MIVIKLEFNDYFNEVTNPGRGLSVNCRKKCGEKKIIFIAYFLHIFAVNAVNCSE